MKKKLFRFHQTLTLALLLIGGSMSAQVTQMWATVHNGTGNLNDVLDAYGINLMTTDANGNIYATGYTNNGSNYDIVTIKYDPSGVVQWTRVFAGAGNGQDGGQAIEVDASGNVYVTGEAIIAGNPDFVVIKYDNSGTQQWAQTYNIATSAYGDKGYDIEIDPSGNVYICGVSYNTTFFYSTLKYNSAGVFQWVATYSGGTANYGYPNRIFLDAGGNSYMSGQYKNVPGNNDDIALIKYNSNGAQQWVRTYNGPSNRNDYAYGMASDGANIILTGKEGFGNGNSNFCTLKYDYNGVFQWAQTFNSPSNLNESALSVAIDGSGNIIVTGSSDSSVFVQARTIKYNSAGTPLWNRTYTGPSALDDVVVDPAGEIYVTGISGNNALEMLTLKYSSAGVLVWDTAYNGTGNGADRSRCVNVNNASVYVFGHVRNSNEDLILIKYNQCIPPSQPGSVAGPTTVCDGSSYNYSITPVPGATSYNWSLPGGWSGSSSTTSITATAGMAGGTITVAASNACGTSLAQTLSVNVNTIVANASSTPLLCNGDNSGTATATQTGTGPFSYLWSNGQTTATASGLSATTYSVTITGAGGCTSQTTVTITQPAPLIFNNTGTMNVTCFGNCDGSVNLTTNGGTPPYSYAPSPNGLCAGTYTFTVTDANNCTATQSVTITQPSPLVVSPTSTYSTCGTCCDGTASSNASGGDPPYMYAWSPGGQTTANISGLCPGNYTICVTDNQGCTNCSTVSVTFNVDIPSYPKDPELSIFPNPFSDFLTVNSSESDGELQVINAIGEYVYLASITNTSTFLDLSYLPKGVYCLILKRGEEIIMRKILKQ